MRSELVFGAIPEVHNRYQLCQLLAKATRKLHKPNNRLQDTVNDALARLSSANTPAIDQQKWQITPELAESDQAA